MATNSSGSPSVTSSHLEVTSPNAIVTRNVTSASLTTAASPSSLRIINVQRDVVGAAAPAADDGVELDGGGVDRLVSTAMNVAESSVAAEEDSTTEMLASGIASFFMRREGLRGLQFQLITNLIYMPKKDKCLCQRNVL